MAKNYIQDGRTIDFIAESDVSSGGMVVIEELLAISLNDVKTGEAGVAVTEGVWELPKGSAVTFDKGVSVYLKSGTISTDNTGLYAGKAWREAMNGETTAIVKLDTRTP